MSSAISNHLFYAGRGFNPQSKSLINEFGLVCNLLLVPLGSYLANSHMMILQDQIKMTNWPCFSRSGAGPERIGAEVR